MATGRNRTEAGILSLLVLCALLLALVDAVPAYASISSEMSDDGNDYGCLYRSGDYLYSIKNPEQDMLVWVDGYWYCSSNLQQTSYPKEASKWPRVHEYLYPDGTLTFQCGGQYYLPAAAGGETFRHFKAVTGAEHVNGTDYPRVTMLHELNGAPIAEATDITRVVIFGDVEGTWGVDPVLTCGDRWFEGFCNLTTIEGLEYLPTQDMMTFERMFAGCSSLSDLDLSTFDTSSSTNIAGMFAGCAGLHELDLSSFDTSSASNMAGMFDDCTSLERLVLGEGWTQQAVGRPTEEVPEETPDDAPPTDDAVTTVAVSQDGTLAVDGNVAVVDDTLILQDGGSSGDTTSGEQEATSVGYATFPIAMSCERDGETVTYRAGEVIPDGAGTYVAAEKRPLWKCNVILKGSDGSIWSRDEMYKSPYAYYLQFEYDPAGAWPTVEVWDGDVKLEEGVDYTTTYYNNVEEDNHAHVTMRGIGSLYSQSTSASFKIVDTGAYAFLYNDGLLYLKQKHQKPSIAAVSATKRLAMEPVRWFDAATPDKSADIPWKGWEDKIKRVVIDASFADVAPASLAGWFAGCKNLEAIEGLEYLNVSSAKSMARLFEGCTSLSEIDLSSTRGINAGSVEDVSGMVRGCSRLERLLLGDLNLSAATNTTGFFDGCSALKEFTCGSGWRNATNEAAQLTLPKKGFRTSGGFARLSAGAAVSDGAGTYRIRDLAMQFVTRVVVDSNGYTCTGKAIRPKLAVYLGDVKLTEGTDYTITYANNVYPGKARATIKGKGVFSGGLEVPFVIVARVTEVGDRLVIKNKSGTFTVRVTKVSKNGLAAEVTILSVQAVSGTRSITLPSQCTIGGVKVTVTGVASKLSGNFRNASSIVIGAKVTTIGSKAFSKAPKVKTLILKSARLKSVRNCLKSSKITQVKTKVTLSVTKKQDYRRWFTSRSHVGKTVTYSYG